MSLWYSAKKAWTFLLDNGAHLEEEAWLPAIVSLLLSIAGMLLDALLVGLVADALGEKMVWCLPRARCSAGSIGA